MDSVNRLSGATCSEYSDSEISFGSRPNTPAVPSLPNTPLRVLKEESEDQDLFEVNSPKNQFLNSGVGLELDVKSLNITPKSQIKGCKDSELTESPSCRQVLYSDSHDDSNVAEHAGIEPIDEFSDRLATGQGQHVKFPHNISITDLCDSIEKLDLECTQDVPVTASNETSPYVPGELRTEINNLGNMLIFESNKNVVSEHSFISPEEEDELLGQNDEMTSNLVDLQNISCLDALLDCGLNDNTPEARIDEIDMSEITKYFEDKYNPENKPMSTINLNVDSPRNDVIDLNTINIENFVSAETVSDTLNTVESGVYEGIGEKSIHFPDNCLENNDQSFDFLIPSSESTRKIVPSDHYDDVSDVELSEYIKDQPPQNTNMEYDDVSETNLSDYMSKDTTSITCNDENENEREPLVEKEEELFPVEMKKGEQLESGPMEAVEGVQVESGECSLAQDAVLETLTDPNVNVLTELQSTIPGIESSVSLPDELNQVENEDAEFNRNEMDVAHMIEENRELEELPAATPSSEATQVSAEHTTQEFLIPQQDDLLFHVDEEEQQTYSVYENADIEVPSQFKDGNIVEESSMQTEDEIVIKGESIPATETEVHELFDEKLERMKQSGDSNEDSVIVLGHEHSSENLGTDLSPAAAIETQDGELFDLHLGEMQQGGDMKEESVIVLNQEESSEDPAEVQPDHFEAIDEVKEFDMGGDDSKISNSDTHQNTLETDIFGNKACNFLDVHEDSSSEQPDNGAAVDFSRRIDFVANKDNFCHEEVKESSPWEEEKEDVIESLELPLDEMPVNEVVNPESADDSELAPIACQEEGYLDEPSQVTESVSSHELRMIKNLGCVALDVENTRLNYGVDEMSIELESNSVPVVEIPSTVDGMSYPQSFNVSGDVGEQTAFTFIAEQEPDEDANHSIVNGCEIKHQDLSPEQDVETVVNEFDAKSSIEEVEDIDDSMSTSETINLETGTNTCIETKSEELASDCLDFIKDKVMSESKTENMLEDKQLGILNVVSDDLFNDETCDDGTLPSTLMMSAAIEHNGEGTVDTGQSDHESPSTDLCDHVPRVSDSNEPEVLKEEGESLEENNDAVSAENSKCFEPVDTESLPNDQNVDLDQEENKVVTEQSDDASKNTVDSISEECEEDKENPHEVTIPSSVSKFMDREKPRESLGLLSPSVLKNIDSDDFFISEINSPSVLFKANDVEDLKSKFPAPSRLQYTGKHIVMAGSTRPRSKLATTPPSSKNQRGTPLSTKTKSTVSSAKKMQDLSSDRRPADKKSTPSKPPGRPRPSTLPCMAPSRDKICTEKPAFSAFLARVATPTAKTPSSPLSKSASVNDIKIPWLPPSPRPNNNRPYSPRTQTMSPMSPRGRPMSPAIAPRKSLSCEGSVLTAIREPPTTPVRRTAATPRCKPKIAATPILTPVKSLRSEKLGKYKTISTEPRSKPAASETKNSVAATMSTPSKSNVTEPVLVDENTDPAAQVTSPKSTKTSAGKVVTKSNVAKQPVSAVKQPAGKGATGAAKQPTIRNTAGVSKPGVKKVPVTKPVIGKDAKPAGGRPSSVVKSNLSSRADLKTVADKKRPVLGSLENRIGKLPSQSDKTAGIKPRKATDTKTEVKRDVLSADGENDPKAENRTAGKAAKSGLPSKTGIPGPRGRTASKLPTRTRIPSLTRTKK